MKKVILKILIVAVILMAVTVLIPVNVIRRSSGHCFEHGCTQGVDDGYSGYGLPFTYCVNIDCYSQSGEVQFDRVVNNAIIPFILNSITYLIIAGIGYLAFHYSRKLLTKGHSGSAG